MDFALDEVDRKLKKDSKQRATQKKRELARPRAIWMVRRCCLNMHSRLPDARWETSIPKH
jgi:hypothetical protein